MLKRCLPASLLAGCFLVVSCGSGAGGQPVPGSTYQGPPGNDQSAPPNSQSPPFNSQSAGGGDVCERVCSAAASCASAEGNCVAECRYLSVVLNLVGCGGTFDALVACVDASGLVCTNGDVGTSACTAESQAANACLESVNQSSFGPTCTLGDTCGGCEDECGVCLCATNDSSYCGPICNGGSTVSNPPPVESCNLESDGCAGCADDCEACLCAFPDDPTICDTTCAL